MKIGFFNQFFLVYYPYICLTVFVIGSALRYDREQYTWKADSSQFLSKKGVWLGNNLFHIGIILLFFGHLIGLLTPHGLYSIFITSETKQILAMVAGGVFGFICFIGMTILIHRRLCDKRIRMTSRTSDIAILLILYVQLILGLISIPISASHSDAASMVNLASWAQHLLTFQPGAGEFIVDENIIFKLHIVLGVTIFLVFPFTRLVHVFSGVAAPFKYLLRSGYQIVRKRS